MGQSEEDGAEEFTSDCINFPPCPFCGERRKISRNPAEENLVSDAGIAKLQQWHCHGCRFSFD